MDWRLEYRKKEHTYTPIEVCTCVRVGEMGRPSMRKFFKMGL